MFREPKDGMKKIIVILSALFLLGTYKYYCNDVVHQAFKVTLAVCDRYCDDNREYGFSALMERGDYQTYLALTLRNLEQCPTSFVDQIELAAILAVYSHHFTQPMRSEMQKKSQEFFVKLLPELETYNPQKDSEDILVQKIAYFLYHAYFYSFNRFKDLYELGIRNVDLGKGTDQWSPMGYFSQGIGAAHYAQEYLLAGNQGIAKEWAEKSIQAWNEYFKHDTKYFHAYVEYALALSILGRDDEMMKALNDGVQQIHTDLNNPEFKEVIAFNASMK